MPSLDDPQIQAQLLTIALAVISLVATVVLGLLAWASAAVKKWLTAKANHTAFHAAAAKVFSITDGLVREAEQTLVKEVKAASKDGKLTMDDGIQIRDAVLERAQDHLGLDGIVDLQKAFGHKGDSGVGMIRRILRTAIEARVSEQREAANGA